MENERSEFTFEDSYCSGCGKEECFGDCIFYEVYELAGFPADWPIKDIIDLRNEGKSDQAFAGRFN